MNAQSRIGAIVRKVAAGSHLHPFPVFSALRGYRLEDARGDLRAGINVALLAFPQGMAYAAIAGLPIEYGIFGSAIAALVSPLWSGSRFIVAGPTNATSVMILASFLSLGFFDVAERAAALPLVVVLSGIFLIIGSLLRVAALVQYVSRSVIAGYITAAAFYIILNQLRKVLGFDIERQQDASFFDIIVLTAKSIPETHLPTFILSIGTALLFFALHRFFRTLPNVAITLVVMALAGELMSRLEVFERWGPMQRLGAVVASEWSFTPPPLSQELISEMAIVALVIAFLSILEGSSIGKTLAAKAGTRIDLNQEVLGMGMANLACGLFQGMPASGSLTRSQLSYSSGVASPLGSIFCGLFLTAGAFLLGGLTRFIPVSVLGVLVISIGLSLINRHVLRVVWFATPGDRMVFVTTLAAALLLRLDFAIILGVAVSILLFLRKAAQPELTEYDAGGQLPAKEGGTEEAEVSIVHVEGDLFFGAAEIFRDQMRRACAKPNLKVVILKMRNAHHLDATSILALEELIHSLQSSSRHFLISETRPEAMKIFRQSGLLEQAGEENVFPDDPGNPTLSTAKAIRRAMGLLGDTQAEVKIFVGGQHKKKKDEPAKDPDA